MSRHFYLSLCPWVCFAVADRTGGIGPAEAAFIAAAVALLIAGHEVRADRTAVLPGLAVGLFLVDGAISLGTTPWSTMLHHYDRAAVTAVLAAAMALSLAATPVTERYTSETVAASVRSQPGFRRYNTLLTRRCAVATALVAVSLALGGTFRGALAQTVSNWMAPIAVVIVATARQRVGAPRASVRSEAAAVSGVLSGLSGVAGPVPGGPVQSAPFRPRLVGGRPDPE